MSPLEYDSKLEEISKELHELEDNAGISEEGERVREGPFIPLHALDMEPYGTAESVAKRMNTKATTYGVSFASYISASPTRPLEKN